MILGDLFESRMGDLDIEYQDWKNMSPVAFHSRYKMTKEQWYHKYQSLVPAEGGIHENAEYNDEAGMAHTNLRTTARAVQGLLDTIDNRENLPEWVQEKIAKAEAMLVSAWDYLLSQEEQGIDPRIEETTEKLSVGDPVVIQGTEYDGKTGDVKEFSPSGKFVVVELYNYGPQAFHLSNVEYNQYADEQLDEKQDACYRKVKSRYKVWPSAYASGALVQCRKKGAANWGNKSKK